MGEPRRPSAAMTVLRLWLIATGALLAALVIWEIAPFLFLLLALTLGVGLVAALSVKLARTLEAWRGPRETQHPDA